MKNKEQAIQRLDALQAEAAKLREIIEQPEPQRELEAGDVWAFHSGATTILTDNRKNTVLHNGVSGALSHSEVESACTYLGKFSEVYVKREGTVAISDVIEALSIKDDDGLSVKSFLSNTDEPSNGTVIETLEALAKLGIK
jgi:hypothetical protein